MAFSVELIDVHKREGASRSLHDVNIGARAGDVTVIRGARGAGKTAVIRLVAGLEHPEEGAVLVGGRAMSGAAGRELRRIQRGMAVMLQGDGSGSSGLFESASVIENMTFPMRQSGHVARRRIDAVAEAYLDRAGLAGLSHERPSALTPGTRKRVALVRALAMRAPLVLLDDPDGHAGPGELGLVRDLILSERSERSRTFVVTTSNSALAAAIGDRVVTLEDGRVVEDAAAGSESLDQISVGGLT